MRQRDKELLQVHVEIEPYSTPTLFPPLNQSHWFPPIEECSTGMPEKAAKIEFLVGIHVVVYVVMSVIVPG